MQSQKKKKKKKIGNIGYHQKATNSSSHITFITFAFLQRGEKKNLFTSGF